MKIKKIITTTIAITALILTSAFSSRVSAQSFMYQEIFPNFSEADNVNMRILGPKAYNSLIGMNEVRFEIMALASNVIGDIKSVSIFSTSSEEAAVIGQNEFSRWREHTKDVKLEMRTRDESTDNTTWSYVGKGKNVMIIINNLISGEYKVMILEGNGNVDVDDDDDNDDDNNKESYLERQLRSLM